jgi:ribosomal protein S8
MAVIKQAYQGEMRHLLSSIRRAITNNQKLILFPKKKHRYLHILELLHNDGFIQSFEERGEFLIIRLKQTY